MATDYEKVYQQSPHALGLPTDEFVNFFRAFYKKVAWVLDVGCGQGRNTLFIARLGHRVAAVDLAPTSGMLCLQAYCHAQRPRVLF